MSYLFVQTLVIQLFVGIVFLLLGLWSGKYLWGHDRHPAAPAPGGDDKDAAEKKADLAVDDELKHLRMLNGKLEKENQRLRKKAGADPEPEPVVPEEKEVVETMEIVDVPEEAVADTPAPGAKLAKSEMAERPEKIENPEAKDERDSLIEIRGVGKVMAKTLEKRGIHSFRQIAEWTKEDIAQLPYGNRVVRDKWQLQAKRLHKEKYGDKI